MLVTETFHGFIETTQDVLLVFEGCRRGLLPRICRRLQEKERKMIQSGSVFVFDERESGRKIIWGVRNIEVAKGGLRVQVLSDGQTVAYGAHLVFWAIFSFIANWISEQQLVKRGCRLQHHPVQQRRQRQQQLEETCVSGATVQIKAAPAQQQEEAVVVA